MLVARIRTTFSILLMLAAFLFLSGCVTTTSSSLTDKADPRAAVEKYVQLGLEYIKRDQLHRARKHLNRALEIDASDASATAALGLIYHQEGESKAAERLFLTSIESDPSYTRGRSYYGAFLYSAERYEEALEQFQVAAQDKQYEGRSQIFSNIALCSLKLGKQKEAVEAYKNTLRLDRGNGRALSGITDILIAMNDYDSAQQYYNRLVRLIKSQGMQHSAQSLWLGIRIAHYFGSQRQEQTLAQLLSQMYPDSEENSLLQAMQRQQNSSNRASQ